MSEEKNHPEEKDPLKKLSKKALRKLARKLKIKNYQRKSPASLRRAIRRAQARKRAIDQGKTLAVTPEPQALKPAQPTPKAIEAPEKPLTPYEQQTRQRQEALKAYQENRLRYLFMPSKFAKTGVHEDYLLETDDEIELPDIYEEEELVALPVDPTQFYLYWDFSPDTLKQVKAALANEATFVLRTHDITNINFTGQNAWRFWDTPCQPLVREWYINTPISDRNICCELGTVNARGQFTVILRSNPLYIPPETLSEVRHDIFTQFVPIPSKEEQLPIPEASPALPAAKDQPDQVFVPMTAPAPQNTPSRSVDFFQTYVPSGPPIVPQIQLPQASAPPEQNTFVPDFQPSFEPSFAPDFKPSFEPSFAPQPQAQDHWILPALEPRPVATATPQEDQWEPEVRWVAGQTPPPPEQRFLEEQGQTLLRTWLGDPVRSEIRWLSEMPGEIMPLIFEEWITDPHDQAVFVSYSVMPWEWTEAVPLGASDWTQRRFLGASITSWYTPGGSERMVTWRRKPGGSEQIQWTRPLGASEQPWSARQPLGASERVVLWPTHESGRLSFRRRQRVPV